MEESSTFVNIENPVIENPVSVKELHIHNIYTQFVS